MGQFELAKKGLGVPTFYLFTVLGVVGRPGARAVLHWRVLRCIRGAGMGEMVRCDFLGLSCFSCSVSLVRGEMFLHSVHAFSPID